MPDAIYLAVGLAGWLSVSVVLKSGSVRLPGKAAKTIYEETSEALGDHHPTLPEQHACALDGVALLEHYAVLGAPYGSWSRSSDISAEASEPSLDEVADYFQSTFQSAKVYADAPAVGHQALVKENMDASSGSGLLDEYGSFFASCGLWSDLDFAAEAQPGVDEMSDYFWHESLQLLLDEASGVVDAPSGYWSSRDIASEAKPGFDDISEPFRPQPVWTSSDEPFLNDALRLLLVEASSNCQVALSI